jgi:hypothetical protein
LLVVDDLVRDPTLRLRNHPDYSTLSQTENNPVAACYSAAEIPDAAELVSSAEIPLQAVLWPL